MREVTERSDVCFKNNIIAREGEKRVDQVISDPPSFIGLTTTVQNDWVEAAGAVTRPMQQDQSGPFCYDLLTQTCPLILRLNFPTDFQVEVGFTGAICANHFIETASWHWYQQLLYEGSLIFEGPIDFTEGSSSFLVV